MAVLDTTTPTALFLVLVAAALLDVPRPDVMAK
jgi:hypothetical protein